MSPSNPPRGQPLADMSGLESLDRAYERLAYASSNFGNSITATAASFKYAATAMRRAAAADRPSLQALIDMTQQRANGPGALPTHRNVPSPAPSATPPASSQPVGIKKRRGKVTSNPLNDPSITCPHCDCTAFRNNSDLAAHLSRAHGIYAAGDPKKFSKDQGHIRMKHREALILELARDSKTANEIKRQIIVMEKRVASKGFYSEEEVLATRKVDHLKKWYETSEEILGGLKKPKLVECLIQIREDIGDLETELQRVTDML